VIAVPLAVTVPVQVRFADLDPLNHVNNVAYFALMETARVEFLREHLHSLFGNLVIARNECDYKKQIRGGTRWVDVDVSVERVGTSSFILLQEIRSSSHVHAVGRTVQVAVDDDRLPRPLSEDERRLLGAAWT